MEHGIILLFKLSFVTSIMALLVLGIRFCLRSAPKIYTYILWIFVFIRAILPISYSSTYSLWNILKHFFTRQPSPEPLSNLPAAPPASFAMGEIYQQGAALSASTAQLTSSHAASATQMPNIWVVTAAIWITGAAALLLYSFYSMQKLRKTVKFATLTDQTHAPNNCRIYESDQIQTAFVLGFFHPVIYLPKGLTASKKRLILEHESVHIRRHDHQLKMAAWLILTLHWFNPMIWFSFYFFNKDMELSCDEQVLSNLGSEIRTDYSLLLLDFAAPNRMTSGMPLAFSEGNTTMRIKNILNYRPIKFGSAAAAVLLLFVTVYGCMGNPQKEPATPSQATESATAEPNTAESETTAADSEEIAFIQTFLQHLIDCHAEDAYAMLSPELKKEADSFCGTFGIALDEPGKHRRINPFTPTDSPVIKQTDTGYYYQMRRPNYPPPPEYSEFHSTDVWEGTLRLDNTENGFQIVEWEDSSYNEIASKKEFEQYSQYYPFSSVAKEVLDWLEEHPEALSEPGFYKRANETPETILTEDFHLIDGKITDIQKENQLQKITYSWEDGSVIFRMEQLLDSIWYVTEAEL